MTENLPKVIGPEEPGDQGHLGPAMRALTPMQQAWVHATVQSGLDATKAAAAAGYTGDRKTLKSTGWKLAHDERVQEALREEASKLIRSHSVMAVSVMAEIARDRQAAPRDRLRAAAELLNRGGLASEHKIVVESRTNRVDQIREIHQLAGGLGLDPLPMLKSVGVTDRELVALNIIDAEFSVVTDTENYNG
jgi:hypothetical protein